MATITIGANGGTFRGGTGNDVYIIDPDALANTTIIDRGGNDTILIYDRPGRTAGELVVTPTSLYWEDYQGHRVTMKLGVANQGMIEHLQWQRLPIDGSPYTHTTDIFVNNSATLRRGNVSIASTDGNDLIQTPTFRAFKQGWSDVYGNDGDDTMSGSNNHAFYLYGGAGDDKLSGVGNLGDYFYGDSGNDLILGAGGDDGLYGGTGRDRLRGGIGDDTLDGGTGSDRMTGDNGADTFWFERGDVGRDIVTDYTAGTDIIHFAGVSQASVALVQQGVDVLLTYGSGCEILVLQSLTTAIHLEFS